MDSLRGGGSLSGGDRLRGGGSYVASDHTVVVDRYAAVDRYVAGIIPWWWIVARRGRLALGVQLNGGPSRLSTRPGLPRFSADRAINRSDGHDRWFDLFPWTICLPRSIDRSSTFAGVLSGTRVGSTLHHHFDLLATALLALDCARGPRFNRTHTTGLEPEKRYPGTGIAPVQTRERRNSLSRATP